MKTIKYNQKRSKDIENLIRESVSRCSAFSVAIIDLNTEEPELFGYHVDEFIYPASCYKVFIGAEVLRQAEVDAELLSLEIEVKSPNDVDKNASIFPHDSRQLLQAGATATIGYLIDVMLTRSDNTASNCLIDLVGRESITEHIIHPYGWHGSEVTRKFLDRSKEEKRYAISETTRSCARHLAEFFFRIEKEELISPFVSSQLKRYMLRAQRNRPGLFLSEYESFYRKGGWLENNLWLQGNDVAEQKIKEKNWAVIRWHNDAGVVRTQKSHYAIAMMSLMKTVSPDEYFDTTSLAQKILTYMEE